MVPTITLFWRELRFFQEVAQYQISISQAAPYPPVFSFVHKDEAEKFLHELKSIFEATGQFAVHVDRITST